MITEHDLDSAIAECQGERNPNANTCIKLAAYYTIKGHLFPKINDGVSGAFNGHSYASESVENTIDYQSDSEFSKAIYGRSAAEILPIIDELMNTLRVMQPRLYDAVMRKL